MFFIHIFYFCSLSAVLCFFVLVKSFCKKKNKKFKTYLMTTFILLLKIRAVELVDSAIKIKSYSVEDTVFSIEYD